MTVPLAMAPGLPVACTGSETFSAEAHWQAGEFASASKSLNLKLSLEVTVK